MAQPRDAIGKTDADFFDADYAETARNRETQILTQGKPMENVRIQGTRQRAEQDQDTSFTATYTGIPLKNNKGNTLGIVTILRLAE